MFWDTLYNLHMYFCGIVEHGCALRGGGDGGVGGGRGGAVRNDQHRPPHQRHEAATRGRRPRPGNSKSSLRMAGKIIQRNL